MAKDRIPLYCTKCGAPMEFNEFFTGKYSVTTGEPLMGRNYRCTKKNTPLPDDSISERIWPRDRHDSYSI